jgi:hypothetical protein
LLFIQWTKAIFCNWSKNNVGDNYNDDINNKNNSNNNKINKDNNNNDDDDGDDVEFVDEFQTDSEGYIVCIVEFFIL